MSIMLRRIAAWLHSSPLVPIAIDVAAFLCFGPLIFMWAVFTGVVPGFWLSLIALIITIALLLGQVQRLVELRVTAVVGAFLLIYGVASVISYSQIQVVHPERAELLVQHLLVLALAALYFLFGSLTGARQTFFGFVFALLAIALYILTQSIGGFPLVALSKAHGDDAVIFGFKQLSDGIVICTLIIIARLPHPIIAYGVSVIACSMLYFAPSKSSFVFGALTLIGVSALLSPPKIRFAVVAIGIVAGIAVRTIAIDSVPIEHLPQVMGIKPAPGQGGAGTQAVLTPTEQFVNDEQQRILTAGFGYIRDNPFFGQFGFQLDSFNRSGLHINNLLDVYAQAGIFPFLAFLALLILLSRQWFLVFRRDRLAGIASGGLLLFAALQWLITRNPSHAILYFCLGYFAATARRVWHPAQAIADPLRRARNQA